LERGGVEQLPSAGEVIARNGLVEGRFSAAAKNRPRMKTAPPWHPNKSRSPIIMNPTTVRVRKQRLHLVLDEPFFGSLLLNLRLIEDC